MAKYIYICIMWLAAATASAEIRWIEKDFDFGLMKEAAGPQTGRSRFVNTGSDTISIFSVKPSCGCTSADFSDAPVAPGDTAAVSYTYDPEMRPGRFDKSVKVRLSDGSRHSIRITGNVLGTPESLASLYPVEAGAMRLSDSFVDAGEVTAGRSPIFFINAYSLSLDSVHPQMTSPSPAVAVSAKNPAAGPGDILTYSLNFIPAKAGRYGPVDIPLEFKGAPDAEPVTIRFRAFVVPDTQKLLLRQKGKNPALALDDSTLSIGEGIQEGRLKAETSLSNHGSGPLRILSVSSESDAVRIASAPKEIKPGKSGSIRLEIEGGSLPQGAFRIPIHIVTDDPDRPRQTMFLTGAR